MTVSKVSLAFGGIKDLLNYYEELVFIPAILGTLAHFSSL
jgi:hypothetical protein